MAAAAPAKRDSLEAMGPVVGEELLEAAAEAAKENSQAGQDDSRNAAEDWPANSGTGGGGGVGESAFEPYLIMTELDYCQELGLIFTHWSDD